MADEVACGSGMRGFGFLRLGIAFMLVTACVLRGPFEKQSLVR